MVSAGQPAIRATPSLLRGHNHRHGDTVSSARPIPDVNGFPVHLIVLLPHNLIRGRRRNGMADCCHSRHTDCSSCSTMPPCMTGTCE